MYALKYTIFALARFALFGRSKATTLRALQYAHTLNIHKPLHQLYLKNKCQLRLNQTFDDRNNSRPTFRILLR